MTTATDTTHDIHGDIGPIIPSTYKEPSMRQHILILNPSGCTFVAETDQDTGQLERVSTAEVYRSGDDYVDPITMDTLTDDMIADWLDQDMASGMNAMIIIDGGADFTLLDTGSPVADGSHPLETFRL